MNNIQQVKSIMNLAKSSNNPNAFIQNLINTNPQVKQIMSMNKGNLKDVYYDMAKQKGVDPDALLKQLMN